MSEMVVFTKHENFDFLKFSSRCPAKHQEALKADCAMVQKTQSLTAQTFGVWALRLESLRDGGYWEDVINPETGYAFYNDGFGAFCKHAFGLSETATSNLTKIAQFIVGCGDNVGQLRENYKDYSFSQLVELSSVATDTHKFFKPTMTVKEMRTAKDYVKKSVEFRLEEKGADYDLLAKAQQWKEKDKKPEKPIEVIPGQIDLDDITDSVEVTVQSIPTSELANDGERVLTEEEREEVIKSFLLFEPWRDKQKRLYDKYKSSCRMYEFLLEIRDVYCLESCSTAEGWSMDVNSKGFIISALCGGAYEFFVGWEQIASQIVALINRGEYYTEDDERIEQARESAHKAGIPFYEGDAEEFNPYVYDGRMSVEDYKLMHEQMEADKAVDDYDEEDEAYEDMQADMETIERESEKSLPADEYEPYELEKGCAPWLKVDFSNRVGIRAFLQEFMSWEQLAVVIPFLEVYRYKFKIGTLYAINSRVSSILENRENREFSFSVRYFWQDKGDILAFETTKDHLEKFIPLHKDEM